MKLQHFILAGFLGLVFSSCDLTGRAESTPHFGFRAMRIVDGDTTFFMHGQIDTLTVGDTIFFETLIFSEFSHLQEFRISRSRTGSADLVWLLPQDTLNKYFANPTDFDNGIFRAQEDFYDFSFPFQFVAKEADEDLTLTFFIQNAGSRDFNTTSVPIRTPIKEKE